MMMSPIRRYEEDLLRADFEPDAAQRKAVEHLQVLFEQLSKRHEKREQRSGLAGIFSRLLGAGSEPPIRGLYFWGGVGRGKTYLMDMFFEALPFERKMRTHFHRFMRRVHKELKALKDQPDPLKVVANTLAQEAKVICFDEFFVSDITDAMILANLLTYLFDQGVVLVATSNIEPSGLYRDGLQRARFLPAIALLESHTLVVNVDGGTDYRLRTLEQAKLYHSPVDKAAHESLAIFFDSLVPDVHGICRDVDIEIEGRQIRAVKAADDVAWFEFVELCDGPRSQNDYIELAREYHAVIVEGVPMLGASNDDQARRFVYMVDEFYDRNVKLIISAQAPIHELYGQGRLAFEFERTISRVLEMQSTEYLARPHRP